MRLFENFDWVIFFSMLIIMSFGLAMVWSLAPELFNQQLVFLLAGLSLFFIFSKMDIRIFQNLSWWFYFIVIGTLFLTLLLGEITRGSIRWISIGSYSIQPSELAKPFLILFFASVISRSEKLKVDLLLMIIILAIIPILFIIKQPDLGSALVICAIIAGILIGGGLSKIQIIIMTIGTGVILPVFWFFLHDYQRNRIISFINPSVDPLGIGYNLIQSVITVGSGQVFGRGLGRGTQSHLAFLPERHTDFMFASLSEEFGFFGAGLLIIFYAILLFQIIKHAQNTKSLFSSLICLGVFSMLCFQVIINAGMNMGIMPITGIPLPLVSYGGSSMMATLISLGIVQAVVKSEKNQNVIEIR